MDTSKLKPNDPRVKYEKAVVRGKTYSYILGEPQGPKRDTILLVHGFPDLSFGWRHQIPYLMSLGFQVVAPDLPGFGGTDAPEDLAAYSYKSVSDDLRELAALFVGEDGQIVLGGHDWGGAVVWRMVLWHPRLIKAVFTFCTPMLPVSREWMDLETLVDKVLPQFRYQLQFAGSTVQEHFRTRDDLRRFFRVMLNLEAALPDGRRGLGAEGIIFDNFFLIEGLPPHVDAAELEHYAEQYDLRGDDMPLAKPLNWYRTRRINYDEDLQLLAREDRGESLKITAPALFVAATRDRALPPAMSVGMERHFDKLARDEIDATHWVLMEQPERSNKALGKWLDELYNGQLKALL